MGRRANGEGSIGRYKDRWRASISVGYSPINGKVIRKQFYGKTRKEVSDKLNKYRKEESFNKGIVDEKITVEEWFYIWLENYKRPNVRPSTYGLYRETYKRYLKNSPISKIKLKDLQSLMIQKYFNELIKNGKTLKTIMDIRKQFSPPLVKAYQIGIIVRNPLEGIEMPKVKKRNNLKYFTEEEQSKILKNVEEETFKIILFLLFSTGLRIGELLALTWKDIDFKNNQIDVNKTFAKKRIFGENGEDTNRLTWVINEPKTMNSYRKVPLLPNVAKMLKDYKAKQIKNSSNVISFKDNFFLFPSERGGALKYTTVHIKFARLLDSVGIERRPLHAIRHTYATRLFEQGVHLKVIQELLGHSSIQITSDIYTHLKGEKIEEESHKIDHLFNF